MKEIIIATSIAAAITSISVVRFRFENKPHLVLAYFLFILSMEWIGEKYFLTPNALGYEIAVVCFTITALFIITLLIIKNLENKKQIGTSEPIPKNNLA